MDYENRTIPEGINVSSEHPLKEFFILSLGLSIATIILVALLSQAASWLVHYIPFETEIKLAENALITLNKEKGNTEESDIIIQAYLQQLASTLAVAQQLPDNMPITVHYMDTDTINAFATLGGHIVIYRGLLEKLPHENALAMVMAHEIAHIKHRDPLVAVGRGITVGLALTTLTGLGDSALSQQLLGQVSLISTLSFSREQEQEADKTALATLKNYYGHSHGATALFEIFAQTQQAYHPPALLSTHPVTAERIRAAENHSKGQISDIKFIALPEALNFQ
jgi:predicted Zn-dependent protease